MHVAALAAWVGASVARRLLVTRARRRGEPAELDARRRWAWLVAAGEVALLIALGSGLLLVRWNGFGFGHPRWLGVKVGLTLALILPLESLHAWVTYGWMRIGLRETLAPPFSKDLRRAAGIEDMLWALALPLYGLALPLMFWLSRTRPF